MPNSPANPELPAKNHASLPKDSFFSQNLRGRNSTTKPAFWDNIINVLASRLMRFGDFSDDEQSCRIDLAANRCV
jgi:hypothetical protein